MGGDSGFVVFFGGIGVVVGLDRKGELPYWFEAKLNSTGNSELENYHFEL